MGEGKRCEPRFPFPSSPKRFIFPSPQPPYDTKRIDGKTRFRDCYSKKGNTIVGLKLMTTQRAPIRVVIPRYPMMKGRKRNEKNVGIMR